MTEILLFLLIVINSAVVYYLREIHNVKVPKKVSSEPTVTRGSYAPVVDSSSGDVGISESKTPQLIEWEADQELLKKNQSL